MNAFGSGDALSQMKMAFQTGSAGAAQRNNAYSPSGPPGVFKPRDFQVTKADSLDYGVGDTVRHIKFGVGIVKNIVEGGRDYEVTVDFDKTGVKKMFAGFAKLKKL